MWARDTETESVFVPNESAQCALQSSWSGTEKRGPRLNYGMGNNSLNTSQGRGVGDWMFFENQR